MFDARDIQFWIEDEQLHVRVPAAFEINSQGELVVETSEEIARQAQYVVNAERGTLEVKYLIGQGRAFDIHIERWLPNFILADKNGYAMAKAIECGLQMMNTAIQEGFQNLSDPDWMPEWALDEKAWEYNLVYDYTAPIETKRGWIKDAYEIATLGGTAAGIVRYLTPYFDNARVEQWWEYSGDPYHFRVVIAGERTDEKDAWAQAAIAQIQNVRSVCDNIIYEQSSSEATMLMDSEISGQYIYDTLGSLTLAASQQEIEFEEEIDVPPANIH